MMSPLSLVLLALAWSGVVCAGAYLICRMRPSPTIAQAIWRGAAFLLIAPFAASVFVPALPALMDAPLAELPMLEPLAVMPEGTGEAVAQGPAFRMPDAGALTIMILALGWGVRALLWAVSQVRLQRLKSWARPVNRPISHWAEALGLSRTPAVHVIPRGAPFLAGITERRVYVPAALIRREGAQQVIVHELVHLKRGDLLARPLERFIADLFWFSPFAWLIRGQLDFWREAVVDQKTVELTGDRIAYAKALTSAARISRDEAVLPVAAFILQKKGNLKMRLTELLIEKPRPRRMGLVVAAALACAAPLAIAQGVLIKGTAATPGADIAYSHAVLDKARLTSPFGNRKHPISGKMKQHDGVDLAEAEGVPVYAPASGVITLAAEKGAYGNLVLLQASEQTSLRFGQLQSMAVKAGDTVKAGDVIGTLGQSGQATGPHLHFEVWRGGVAVDPQTEEGLTLASDLFVPAGLEKEAGASESTDPSAMTEACSQVDDFLSAPVTDVAWVARKAQASSANAAAGLAIGKDWQPETVSHPSPSYPVPAATEMLSGACLVMFDLGTDGLPKNMQAACSDPVFEASAAEMKGARFEPIKGPDGKPVEVKGLAYPIEYCIEG
ncbi:hypothetical protein HY29_07135 [Hyphomonas beringensis]|uniref:TonB C-terminal domain-containing protein n=1 Tax=Hyphomonas beringensis TaxID=1280946 RepID=A0A062U2Y7_9PROT|nr:peptidoglycan DD-metalloendopeptidase family protein [Hyphomonas beringensis]KCZ50530.1 hypothetical protein HY29_07135 [Hyphomonas beringensis]